MAAAATPTPSQPRPPSRDYRARGYHRLAGIMGQERDIAIFRRFDELNMLNLLSLQAEIFEMQQHFVVQCSADDYSTDGRRRQYSSYFHELHGSHDHGGVQHHMLLQLREKLKEYTSQVSELKPPDQSQFRQLRDWLVDPRGGNGFQKGMEARIYEDTDRSSYVVLDHSSDESDLFSRFIAQVALQVFHRFWGEKHPIGKVIDEESQLVSYRKSKVHAVSTAIATALSSIFPVVTIYVLYLVKDTVKRICITIAFTGSFALLLATFSSARRVEIFAATATFAAVEVVFIGSAMPGNSQ